MPPSDGDLIEQVEHRLEFGKRHQCQASLFEIGQAFEIGRQMASHFEDSGFKAFKFHGADQMTFCDLDAFGNRWLRQQFAGIEIVTYFAEYPWSAEGRTPDHYCIDTIFVESHTGILRGGDIAVADDRDMYGGIVFDFADESPVGSAGIELGSGTTMNCESCDADILKPQSNFFDVDGVLIPSEACFDRNRHIDCLNDLSCHFDHFRDIAHHTAAGTASSDFAHRTPEIDIDNIGAYCGGDTCGLHHRFDHVAVDLDSERAFEVGEIEFEERLGGITDKSVGSNEFGIEEIGTELFAGNSERGISNIFHRSEEERFVAERYIADIHSKRIWVGPDTCKYPYTPPQRYLKIPETNKRLIKLQKVKMSRHSKEVFDNCRIGGREELGTDAALFMAEMSVSLFGTS